MEVEELVMQEEANQRTVGLVVTATKFTGRTFARAVDRYLQHRRTVVREHKQEKNRDPSTYKTNQPKRAKDNFHKFKDLYRMELLREKGFDEEDFR